MGGKIVCMGKGVVVLVAFLYFSAFCAEAVLPMGMAMTMAMPAQASAEPCETHHPDIPSSRDGMAVKHSLCCPMACCGNIIAPNLPWNHEPVAHADNHDYRLFMPLLQAKGLFHPPKQAA